jgi:hypothetical protein
MGGHVFICYAREDSNFVLKLAANLKGRGVPVWLDQWDIPLGANWNATIDDAIYSSEHFLIVLSPNSVGSNEVSGELLLALKNKKHVVPVLYQSCRIPRQLLPIQRADFTSCSPDDDTTLNDILRALGIKAGASPRISESLPSEEKYVAQPKSTASGKEGNSDWQR